MANNITVKDANGNDVEVKSIDNGGVQLAAHTIYDSTGTNAAAVTGANAVKVDGSGVTQPVSGSVSATVSGSVTANAGTNLNTSDLALESGGNLATLAGIVSTARAAVNPISGQTGVQGGSGSVSALTQRVVLATDVALPAGTNAIGKLSSNDGVDIGDVTVNNASGASAVNIQDGGNSITVDYATTGSGTATGALRVELPTNGTGVIATVSAVTAISNALPAGTNLLGRVSASAETGTVYQGTTACTPVFVAVAASSSGNNTIVAAAGGSNKIRVLAVQLIANGTVNAKWQSGAGGTDLTGLAYLVANSGYVLPYNPVGWFETAANTLLNLNLSGGVAVGGSIVYIVVT